MILDRSDRGSRPPHAAARADRATPNTRTPPVPGWRASSSRVRSSTRCFELGVTCTFSMATAVVFASASSSAIPRRWGGDALPSNCRSRRSVRRSGSAPSPAVTNVGPIGVGGHTRVEVDVGDHHRLPMAACPAADAGGERETLALPQRFDRVLFGVIALLAIAQHERRAVRPGEIARGNAHDRGDGREVAREGQLCTTSTSMRIARL